MLSVSEISSLDFLSVSPVYDPLTTDTTILKYTTEFNRLTRYLTQRSRPKLRVTTLWRSHTDHLYKSVYNECTSIWFLISVFQPPTAYNCFPISRQSAPVVRQRSSSAQFSRIGDPWERTVWPKPATPQATKFLARCFTRLSTGQPRLYGDFSVTCLTCRYLMFLNSCLF